jgi:hypothetical protein
VRFTAFDDLLTVTMKASDRDACHRPPLPAGRCEDEAQCDINLSRSPLLEHYQGGFREALCLQGDAEEQAAALLANEVVDALKEANVLSADDIFVPHPVHRSFPIIGKINIQHKPAFVQENGSLYVMETVDFTIQQKKRARDHAGWAAYMFSDIRAVRLKTHPIAIVRITETDTVDEEVETGLALLRYEGEVVNWLNPTERKVFLEERQEVAFAQ